MLSRYIFISLVSKIPLHRLLSMVRLRSAYRLLVRGEDWSCREAGMNVLVLSDDLDSSGEIAKGFALQESPHAANRLTDYLNHIPIGRTVSCEALP